MRELSKKKRRSSSFVPDFMAQSLREVDFAQLRDIGVRFVAIDADSTLVEYRQSIIDPKTKRHLQKQRQYIDGWCIASNRVTSGLGQLSKSIDAPVVPTSIIARKPRQRYFRRILRHFSAKPAEVALIGDKLLADIWGGNRARFTTVWVEQLGDDGFHDRAIRVRSWERRMRRKFIEQQKKT